MLSRWTIRGALAVLALLIVATPALAGGWAVITLDQLPKDIAAGTPITIGFTVRQHGHTLRDDLKPLVVFNGVDGTDSFSVTAAREGASGHYTAAVTFPRAGTWAWSIDIEPFGMATQPMPELSVRAASVSRLGASGNFLSGVIAWLTQVLRSSETAPAASLASVGRDLFLARHLVIPAASLASVGQDLFLAKGCAMCHAHSAVTDAWHDFGPIEMGPDLTHLKADPEYLRRWLKNPSSIKPGTQMPTLGLSDGEIEALIAFLLPNQAASATGMACPATAAPDVRPPNAHLAAWSPDDAWYHSPDGLIWVAENNIAGIPVGDTTKVLWGKPAEQKLTVTGRRLDADAPPLVADVSPYYLDDVLNPSGIGFPTAGCWLIDARAGKSVLWIVVEVPEQSSQR